ncbi:DUF211 domain-containing protein [Natrialbaceae archaeon AArc-T1-2]|uniref:DUF211 domain-containing protein n=1 Tax=Natrialbaceae archaeon AArc-T1-2 TaxID=3053904 RepID=UPI00255AA153|nr:DUF211 domain-containing protein [Natrialbaceae archaeon AArc-T1-2]WIV68514.1 DUF211 domain-containing protein [Natrialbaceae archaeon AArc-T1-2]
MVRIRRLVLDVLKPHDPGTVAFTEGIGELEGIEGVTATLVEIDENVRTLRVTLEGEALDVDAIEDRITDLGGSVHSVDEVSCGERIVEDSWTGGR